MKRLDLSWLRNLTEPVLAALADALLEGACPQLTALSLMCDVNDQPADPLARAITVGTLPRLEELRLWGCRIGPEAGRGLVEAFRARVAPELRKARISSCRLEIRTAKALHAAIVEGCPGVRKKTDVRICS
jgi:hypothetical protein